MGYDLSFWREDGQPPMAPVDVQRRLLDRHPVEGVAELDVAVVRAAVEREFGDWVRADADTWTSQDDAKAFQLFVTRQLFHVSCYGLTGAEMNRVIDVALGLGCRLFDPQTNERFD